MADKSKIEWCDATWNPITGCTPISEGCRNCYAERMAKRFPKLHGEFDAPKGAPRIGVSFRVPVFHPDRLDRPARWKRPRRIFVGSMTDLFHDHIPLSWLTDVMVAMDRAKHHTFMVLTKRPERMKAYLDDIGIQPPPHIWWGVTAENQQTADERIPILLQTHAAKRFVSVEPMVGPVDLENLANYHWRQEEELDPNWPKVRLDALRGHMKGPDDMGLNRLDWVICGGESGLGARPMHPSWAELLRTQCQEARVPFFFKQWGEWSPYCPDNFEEPKGATAINPDGTIAYVAGDDDHISNWSENLMDGYHIVSRAGKKNAGCRLDAGECKEFPR
jgi:protein gp37